MESMLVNYRRSHSNTAKPVRFEEMAANPSKCDCLLILAKWTNLASFALFEMQATTGKSLEEIGSFGHASSHELAASWNKTSHCEAAASTLNANDCRHKQISISSVCDIPYRQSVLYL